MVNIVCTHHDAGKLLQQVIFFVGGSRRADHPDSFTAVAISNLSKLLPNQLERFFPGCRNEAPVLLYERLCQTVFVLRKIECVTSLDAEEVTVDAALVAVVSTNNFHAGVGP